MRKLAGLALALALLGACVAPTLPLPPPATPDLTTEGVPAGMVRLTSYQGAEPEAILFIYNGDPALPDDERVGGSQADSSGTWNATVYGKSGDVLEISQQYQGNWSPPTTVQVQ